jgi:hypothetical protein
VLEAISIVFASLYTGMKIERWNNGSDLKYTIKYKLKDYEVEITDGLVKLLKDKGVEKNKVIRRNRLEYLPEEVIACYSGDESRLWDDIYARFYFSYFAKISKGYRGAKQNLVYVNKYSWQFALLSLLCHEKSHGYLKNLLNVDDLSNIKIRFVFDDRYESKKLWFSKTVQKDIDRRNDITELIQRIKDEQDDRGEDLVYSQINSIELRVTPGDKFCRKLFYLLFAAGMPKENKLFQKIEIEFNGIGLKQLSEGEKKIILIKCIADILANENSLILLDEPDAHMHIGRKNEIKSIIDKPDYFTLLSTHSPALLNCIEDLNIRIVNNGSNGLEVIPIDKVKSIEQLTDGAFSLMDATLAFATVKDILLVEGTNDYKYFTKALEVLKRTKSPKYNNLDLTIINCGGAGNVGAVLEQVIIPHLKPKQLCIATFDNDDAGRNGIKSVNKVLDGKTINNVKPIFHPKIAGWPNANDFFTEDYFPVACYKPRYESKVAAAATFKALSSVQNPKNIIEDIYQTLGDADFDNFELLFDQIVKLQTAFRTPPSVSSATL